MKPLTRTDLEAYGRQNGEMKEWIRVQLDTGGIAAGAEAALAELTRLRDESRQTIPILRVGSVGYSFADPLVEVKCAGLPRVLYGQVSAEVAGLIIRDHVMKKRLVDDHAIATRQRSLTLDQPVTHILVRDTGADAGNKTEFCQFSLIAELKRRGLAEKVQVVRALDLGIYHAGVAVQLLPSAVTYTNVLAPDVARIVAESVAQGHVLDDLLCKQPNPQVRIVLQLRRGRSR